MIKHLNILYVSSLHTFGGIETLVSRLAKDKEHNVAVLSSSLINDSIRIELMNSNIPILEQHFSFMRFALGLDDKILMEKILAVFPNCPDIIYSFDATNLFYSLHLQVMLGTNIRVVTGVYHPSEYSWIPEFFNLTSFFIKKIIQKIPVENIIFMNEACRDYNLELNRKFINSPIVPIPVNIQKFFCEHSHEYMSYKIVSVGRICDFKTYNFTMLEVIKQLISVDKRFEYHIYGHGELEGELQECIVQMNLDKHVFFHGKIEYGEFPQILSDAYIFVGMGTAIIESSAAGVPSILAIAGSKSSICFGWFHELSGFNVGESSESIGQDYRPIFDLIKSLYDNPDKYLVYSAQANKRSLDFDQNTIIKKLFKVFYGAASYSIGRVYIKFVFGLIALENKIYKILKVSCPNRFRHALKNS